MKCESLTNIEDRRGRCSSGWGAVEGSKLPPSPVSTVSPTDGIVLVREGGSTVVEGGGGTSMRLTRGCEGKTVRVATIAVVPPHSLQKRQCGYRCETKYVHVLSSTEGKRIGEGVWEAGREVTSEE
jgi:hypothetical protein